MFSWMQALADEEERRDRDDEESPVVGLSGLPIPSPLNPQREGGSAYAALLATQRPAAKVEEGAWRPTPPDPVTAPPTRTDFGMPTTTSPAAAPPAPASKDRDRDFEPLPTPTFGALPPATPPPPLDFEEPQSLAPPPTPTPPTTPFGTPTAQAFETPANAAFPTMTPPPALPALPDAPPPLTFPDVGGAPSAPAFGMPGTQTGTQNQTGQTTGTQANTGATAATQQHGWINDFNTAMTALGMAKPALNAASKLLTPAAATTGPQDPESMQTAYLGSQPPLIDPEATQTAYLGGQPPLVDPEMTQTAYLPPWETGMNPVDFVDPLGGPPVDTSAAGKAPGTPAVPGIPTGPSQSLIGKGVESVLGPEAGAAVNQALPYVGAVLATALGLANGQPPAQALLGALPALMQSHAAQKLITEAVTAVVGPQAAGLVGNALPYVGQVLSFGMALAGGQDVGMAALNAAIGVAAAALAPATAGLSVVAGAVLQFFLGSLDGPSEQWLDFGKRVGETNATNIAAVDTLVPAIIGAKTVEELEAARAAYLAVLYKDKLDPETGQPMAFTPHEGEYLPGIPGATGEVHEWGKTFNPNELNAALNHLYGTKLTSLTNGVGDPDQAMNYLMGILPMIQHGATTGGNPGVLPALYSEMTPAGPALPALTPPPVEPMNAAAWTGSA